MDTLRHKGMKEELVRRIADNRTGYIVRDGDKYEVHVQDIVFICWYTEEEIARMASICLELLEELERIKEGGYSKAELEKVGMTSQDDEGMFFETMKLYRTFVTEKMEEMIEQLADVARVGGAYFLLLSRPTFIRAICVVYEMIIDRFDDDNAYFSALFMLVRMAMHMHCNKSLISREPFDYTEWRRDNLPDEDVRTLSKKAMLHSRSLGKP